MCTLCRHVHARGRVCVCMYVCVRARSHVAFVRASVCQRICTCMCARGACTHARPFMYVCMRACVRTCVYTYIRAWTKYCVKRGILHILLGNIFKMTRTITFVFYSIMIAMRVRTYVVNLHCL